MARSAHSCAGFVEVWDWVSVPSGNVSAIFLNCFVNVSTACVGRPGRFLSWSCNNLTASMRSLSILVDSSLGVSI